MWKPQGRQAQGRGSRQRQQEYMGLCSQVLEGWGAVNRTRNSEAKVVLLTMHIYPQAAQDGPAGREPVPGGPAAETGGLSGAC